MDGLCVDAIDDDCIVWMVNDDRCKSIPRSNLPSAVIVGSWLKIGQYEYELVEKDIKDWFLMTRSGAFSRSLGTVDVDDEVEYDSDRIFYTECEWDSHTQRMVIYHFSVSEWKSNNSEEYMAAELAFDAKYREKFWVNGVVCGRHEEKFFILTPAGMSLLFPDARERLDVDVRIGMYCRALAERMHCEGNCRYRIIEFEEVRPPSDHHSIVKKQHHVEVTCTCVLRELVGPRSSPTNWIFWEPFLGDVVLLEADRPRSMFFSLGDRVQLAVFQKPKQIESKYCMWIVDRVVQRKDPLVTRSLPKEKSFFGVITGFKDGRGYFVFCNDFRTSLELPENTGDSIDPSYVGKWIEFRRVTKRIIDPPIHVIPDIYPTRVISDVTEILVKCSYKGIREHGKAVLESQLGTILDEYEIIEEERTYELWIVTFRRSDYQTRWKISFSEGKGTTYRRNTANDTQRSQWNDERDYGENRRDDSRISGEERTASVPVEERTASVSVDQQTAIPSEPSRPSSPSALVIQLAAAFRRIIFLDNVADAVVEHDEQLYNDIVDILYPPDFHQKICPVVTK